MKKDSLKKLLVDAAELGAVRALVHVNALPEYVSQREAFRIYGEARVRKWVSTGSILPQKGQKANSKIRYKRIELEIIAKSEK